MTQVFNKARFTKSKVILEGKVKFSELKDPKGGKTPDGTEIPPKFNLVLLVEPGSKTATLLEELYNEAVTAEKAALLKGKKVGVRPLSLEPDFDQEGNETGMLKITLSRKENQGRPIVVDAQNVHLDKAFIRRNSDVNVQVFAKSYNVGGMAGLSLVLVAVQIVKEADLPEGYERKPRATELAFEAIEGVSNDNPFDVL